MDFLLPILNTLALAAVAIAIMVGLVESPWQLLLLILVLATIISQWLIRRSHLQNVLTDLEDSDTHSQTLQGKPSVGKENTENNVLSYRGANYTPSSPNHPPKTPLELVGKYRGGWWRSGS
jgi:membrane protein implicated in regulation of membrane protease activity